MKERLKRSLIIGVVVSLSLHITSAIITAFFPYHDLPKTPPLVLLFLLEVGWRLSGEPWPMFRLWQEIIAAAINGGVFSIIVFGFLFIWNSGRREARTRNESSGRQL
jgi:uncharacterized membrane protein